MAIQQSLKGIWEAANGNEYSPAISKDGQFTLGLVLLVLALICTGFFGMNPSMKNVIMCGVPASLAAGFGAVYMICAVGVYV